MATPVASTPAAARTASARVYASLREQVIGFALKPGERLTELDLAARFGVSRTPVREALRRLVEEGLLVPEGARGFAVRALDAQQCFDLYELRLALEVSAARLACERASDAALAELVEFTRASRAASPRAPVERLAELDEAFHRRIAALGGNAELASTLDALNARIRFIRWIDMEGRRATTQGEHAAIAQALAARKPREAARLLEAHIGKRMEDIVEAIRRGIARIYVTDFELHRRVARTRAG